MKQLFLEVQKTITQTYQSSIACLFLNSLSHFVRYRRLFEMELTLPQLGLGSLILTTLILLYLKKLYLFTIDPASGCKPRDLTTASVSEAGKASRIVKTWHIGHMIFRYPFN